MSIINVRIDERLVHGIVATFWLPKLKVDRVVCIDEESANNPMIKSALRMATPSHIFLSIIPLEKAVNNFKTNKYGNERVMIIVKTPDLLLKLQENKIDFDEVILGNLGVIKKKEGAVSITNYLNVTTTDRLIFEQLHNQGITLTSQLIPDDVPADFYEMMKAKFQ